MKKQTSIVSGLIERFTEVIAHASLTLPVTVPSWGVEPVHVTSVTDFWEKTETLDLGTYVEIEGALSTFAPALPGVPRRKRELHLKTRRQLRNIQDQMLQQGYPFGPTTEDALLAYTAGQMVIRPNLRNAKRVYLGFYQSIVRNSIPIFIEKRYYDQFVGPLFAVEGSDVMEVRLVGRLDAIPRNQLREFINAFGLQNIYEPELLDSLMPQHAVHVEGPADIGQVKHLGIPSRYLDGDIWVAIRNGGPDRVVSRFLDLSDPIDLLTEREALRNDAEGYYKGMRVVSEFDQLHRIFKSEQLVDPAHILRQVQIQVRQQEDLHAEGEAFDVFLSHNSSDKSMARALASKLKDRGISVWLDESELVPGQVSQEGIEQALKVSRTTAVLIGPSGLGPWESEEMRIAIRQSVESRHPVIPVLLPHARDPRELPSFLRNFTWVDLRAGLTTEALDQLVRGINV